MINIIEFRAWDSTIQNMYYHIEKGLKLNTKFNLRIEFGEILCWPTSRFKVMQFTGEIDKCRNKIFEDDIVFDPYWKTIHLVKRVRK